MSSAAGKLCVISRGPSCGCFAAHAADLLCAPVFPAPAEDQVQLVLEKLYEEDLAAAGQDQVRDTEVDSCLHSSAGTATVHYSGADAQRERSRSHHRSPALDPRCSQMNATLPHWLRSACLQQQDTFATAEVQHRRGACPEASPSCIYQLFSSWLGLPAGGWWLACAAKPAACQAGLGTVGRDSQLQQQCQPSGRPSQTWFIAQHAHALPCQLDQRSCLLQPISHACKPDPLLAYSLVCARGPCLVAQPYALSRPDPASARPEGTTFCSASRWLGGPACEAV